MTEMDVREFLRGCQAEELASNGILRGGTRLLNNGKRAIEELLACAESSNITAIYTRHDGGYAPTSSVPRSS